MTAQKEYYQKMARRQFVEETAAKVLSAFASRGMNDSHCITAAIEAAENLAVAFEKENQASWTMGDLPR